MSRARTLAGAIGSDGALNVADVAGLAAVASSGSASDLGTGTLPIARIADGAVTAAKLASTAVTDKLGYTPINKAGDTLSNALNMHSLNVSGGSQRQIRTWEWAVQLNKNTRYNFMYNNSSYTDVHFILTMEGFHSSRSYAMYGGVFGGYGSQFTNIGGGGTSAILSQVNLDTGRYYLGVDVGSTPIDPYFYFHMTVFGDTGVTLVNGAWY